MILLNVVQETYGECVLSIAVVGWWSMFLGSSVVWLVNGALCLLIGYCDSSECSPRDLW